MSTDAMADYTGYKRVKVTMYFVDNGQGAGYLRLMFEDGTYVKVWPSEDTTLYDLMQEHLNRLPADERGGTAG